MGWSQQELADRSGVPQGTISKIERGDQDSSRYDVHLADALGISPVWLTKGIGAIKPDNNVQEVVGRYGSRSAPVISTVKAGSWAESPDIYQPGDGEEFRPVPDTCGPHAIWLRVTGDSMTNPYGQQSIPEGALILVDPDKQPVSGRLVVARLEDTGEVTFKKLVIDAGRHYLKPLNPNYPMIPINGNCKIVGVVTKMEMDL